MIPVYGDALALVGDTKQYIEHPETATIGNLLGTAATVLPWTPNVVGAARKVENTLEDAARAESKVAGKIDDLPVQAIDPHETRFSQKTVSFQKSNRAGGRSYTFDDIQGSMRNEGWRHAPIDVVRMPDGQLTSLDNTRLLAARGAGIKAQARVHEYDEVMPKREAGRIRGLTQQNATWGQAVEKRISTQRGQFSKMNPNGSMKDPKVTGRPKTNEKE